MSFLLYLKYKLFPSEDSDGVKVSLADVWADVRSGWLCRSRRGRRRGSSRLGSCGKDVVREKCEMVNNIWTTSTMLTLVKL